MQTAVHGWQQVPCRFRAQWCRRTFLIAGGILVVFVVLNGISYLNVMEKAFAKNGSGKFEVYRQMK